MATALMLSAIILLAYTVTQTAVGEYRIRMAQRAWRALHPPPRSEEEGEEEWATRVSIRR